MPCPMTSGPDARNGVGSVVLFAATELAVYRVVGVAVSVDQLANCHLLTSGAYARTKPSCWVPRCATATRKSEFEDGFTQAVTVKLVVVSITGPVVVMAPVPSNVAEPP